MKTDSLLVEPAERPLRRAAQGVLCLVEHCKRYDHGEFTDWRGRWSAPRRDLCSLFAEDAVF